MIKKTTNGLNYSKEQSKKGNHETIKIADGEEGRLSERLYDRVLQVRIKDRDVEKAIRLGGVAEAYGVQALLS